MDKQTMIVELLGIIAWELVHQRPHYDWRYMESTGAQIREIRNLNSQSSEEAEDQNSDES